MISQDRLAHVDGLRGIAVVAVLLFHLGISAVPGGFVGVDVFFVISGYVVTRMIRHELTAGSFEYRRFYIRRVKRLYPALLATIAFAFVGSFLLLTPEHFRQFAASAIAAITGWSNILFWSEAGYFDIASTEKPLLHTWSLSLEWQFYLVWPALCALLMTRTRQWVAPTCIAILGAGSFLANLALYDYTSTLFYWMPFRIFEFAIGALVLWLPKPRQINRWASPLTLGGLALIAVPAIIYTYKILFPSYNALAPVLGTAAVIYAGGSSSVGRLLLANPLAQNLGRWSYGIYLVHWPIIALYWYVVYRTPTLPEALVLAAVSIGLGAVVFKFIEQPFWNGAHAKRSFLLPGVATISAALILPSASAAISGWAWRLPADAAAAASWTKDEVEWHWGRSGCVDPCTYGNPNANASILVIGDSHVDHYAQTLAGSGGMDFNFRHLHGGSCFMGKELEIIDTQNKGCFRANAIKFDWIADPSTVAVIHAQRWTGYMGSLRRKGGGVVEWQSAEEMFRSELEDIAVLYREFHGPVVVVNFVPSARLSCLSMPQYLNIGCMPTDLDASRSFATIAREFVAKSAGKFSFVNPADFLCNEWNCDLLDAEARLLYVDDNGHIARYAAWRIVPAIMDAVRLGLQARSSN